MRVIAVIPARGGSKGVPRKNIRVVAGKPLIVWTIEAARKAGCIERIIVSTDDEEIACVARQWNAEVVMRPTQLATDAAPTLPVLQHVVDALAAEGYRPDAVITLQPTSPLRTARHVEDAMAMFSADASADSLVSCVRVPHIFHPQSVMRRTSDGYLIPYLDQAQPYQRQAKDEVWARNGAAIYITRTERLADYVFGGRLLSFPMSPEDSLDIDEEADLLAAEQVLRNRRQ